ncbi:hypothetical protein [Occallatibacter savannae]|uniref:hypothetical protein n=1 Tax=Occallatibacter savannae TaxID=1002691 RepID=UPI000D69D1C4|nr:hypothetical protein [Occallatibacter savannae]
MKRVTSMLSFLVASMFPFISVDACSPGFSDDVFVRKLGADHPSLFVAGRLGVLLPTYSRTDLSVAYRYLNGGSLSPEEQKAYQPTVSVIDQGRETETVGTKQPAEAIQFNEPEGPADLWLEARGHYAAPPPDVHPVKQFSITYRAGFFLAGEYENCQTDAFRTAVSTLENRAKAWGPHSLELADWIEGQDAVFSNCGGTGQAFFYPESAKPVIHPLQPKDEPAGVPLLLRQDRAYQKAAAQFYAAQFQSSRAGFQAISQDSASPWHNIARYLVARTLIREAFLSSKNDAQQGMANFNSDLMKQAQHQLESLQGEHLKGISPHGVQSILNFVRLRTEPAERLREISSALAGPKPDPEYKQDLADLDWYLNSKLDSTALREDFDSMESPNRPASDFEKAFTNADELSATSPLIDWLITFQSPADAAKKHAILEWQQHNTSVPWLVAAMAKVSSTDPEASALITASAQVPQSSPAWPTIAFHRLRLLIDTGHAPDARRELERDFPNIEATGNESALNLFTGLRMHSAPTLEAALSDAPRKILDRSSEQQSALDQCLSVMQDPKRKYDCKDRKSAVEFSEDATDVFNKSVPLDTLAQAAESKALPPPLSQSVAVMTWVRAVMLKNEEVADKMLPLLPQKLQQQAGPHPGFRAQMALLRNPGLRPFLDPGVQRSASYDFVESFADNWWCGGWNMAGSTSAAPNSAQSVAFLTPSTKAVAEKENAALLALGSADEYLGSQVIDYAHSHPDDPDVPEALYLTLRMIRYGCYHGVSEVDTNRPDGSRVPTIAREVGALMRQRYATNPWTKKAAPYVWPVKKSG